MTRAHQEFCDALLVLGSLPAATVHEAAGKSGALHAGIQGLGGAKGLAGVAFTARCEPYQTLPVLRALDYAKAGEILVVDAGEDFATVWGGSSTLAAEARGLGGLVTNGAIRDSAEVAAARFPVFARGRSLRGTFKTKEGEIGVPVNIGGQMIAPGDFVRGDDDGVTVVAADRILDVAACALVQRDKEEALDAALRRGGRLTDLLGL